MAHSIGSRGNVSDIASDDGDSHDVSRSSSPKPLRNVDDIVRHASGGGQLPRFFLDLQRSREAKVRREASGTDGENDSSATGEVIQDVSESPPPMLPPGLFSRQTSAISHVTPKRMLLPEKACSSVEVSMDERWYMCKPAHWRRNLLRFPWRCPIAAMHIAALVIQTAWRTSWLAVAKPSAAKVAAPPVFGRIPRPGAPAKSDAGVTGARHPTEPPVKLQSKTAAMALAGLRQRYFDLLKRACTEASLAAAGHYRSVRIMTYPTFEGFCAAMIQGKWRSTLRLRIMRRVAMYKVHKLYQVAAFEIQHRWREYRARRQFMGIGERDDRELEGFIAHAKRCDRAARMIQRAWSACTSYRIYESLKEMIAGIRACGDPCLLLRHVLPRESMLLDPAMQAHVRFRLGGSKFPPSVYYKIYTHGAICDVGAFAPRNYHLERRYGPEAKGEGWYEREENNGWRPLVTRLSPGEERYKDEVERASARKCIKNFHHSRVRRRQDVERRRQRRAIEWMQKMYGLEASREGALPSWAEAGEESAGMIVPATHMAGSPSAPSGVARFAASGSFPAAPRPPPRRHLAAPSDDSPRSPRFVQDGASPPPPLQPRPPAGPPPLPGKRAPRRGPTFYSGSSDAVAARPASSASGSSGGMRIQSKASTPFHDFGVSSPSPEIDDDFLEDQRLLDWSQQVNFDEYMGTWQAAACTDFSEGNLPIRSAAVDSRFAVPRVY